MFDIEIDESDPDKLVDIIASLEPTFGGINLEDIKAPECFMVERKLRERMSIPVFHDDQHGTAIIVGAALINALEVIGKKIDEVKVAASGAGAAGIACLDMMVSLGVKPENIMVSDKDGVLHSGRENLAENAQRYVRDTDARTLGDIVKDADVFLGVSAGGRAQAGDGAPPWPIEPIIFALANPTPEILPEEAREVRPDCIMATGRSDYPNQVNNVLCFPYIFRGALDVGATGINEDMKVACVHAIADLARREASDISVRAYGGKVPHFGADYLIPQPFDPRLLVHLAPAVARAAMESGMATRPIEDFKAYTQKLWNFVFRTGLADEAGFRPCQGGPAPGGVRRGRGRHGAARSADRGRRATGAADPHRPSRMSLPDASSAPVCVCSRTADFELCNIHSDPRFDDYWQHYHKLMERRGVTPDAGQVHRALARHRHRRADGGTRRCRRHDLRTGGPLHQEAVVHAGHHRP